MAQNISKFVPEIYSKKLLRDAKQITDFKNVMCNFDWEGEIKNFGDTVRICSPNADLVQIGEGVQKLTPIEFDIFNLLFQNHGNMVSAQKLLKEVWGYEPDDNVETIRVHIRHLRSKIDKISDGKKYIETVYGGGYKLVI